VIIGVLTFTTRATSSASSGVTARPRYRASGVIVDSPEEIDRLTVQMRTAGARVTKEPVDAEFFTGRSATSAAQKATPS
jgi:hypothetical protein